MTIVTPAGNHATAQIADNYPDQVRDYTKRLELTTRYGELISVANPRRLEFMQQMREIFATYP